MAAVLFARECGEAKKYCPVLEDERIPATVEPGTGESWTGVAMVVSETINGRASKVPARFQANNDGKRHDDEDGRHDLTDDDEDDDVFPDDENDDEFDDNEDEDDGDLDDDDNP